MTGKEILRASEAELVAIRAREAFFDALREAGIIVEEGALDGAGEPFTAVRVRKIRRVVDVACWCILEDKYAIREDQSS